MQNSVDTQLDILSLTLDGFEGPIDLLLNFFFMMIFMMS
jgi:hypothetical protein